MKRFITLILSLSLVLGAFAQKDAYKINVQIKGVSDTTLLLGYHYGSKKLVSDTIKVDKDGKGVFEGDTLLEAGMYMILTPDLRFFEIIIDQDQVFSLKTDTTNLFKNLEVSGSEDNTVFNNYQKKSSSMYTRRSPIYDKLRHYYGIRDTMALSEKKRKIRRDSIQICKDELDIIKDEMIAYEDDIIKKYPKSLLASVLNTMRELDIPDYPRDAEGNITDSLFKYTYLKTHFFDKVDFSDHRLLRTPVYEMKINQYFDKEIIQIPDSIIPEVDKFLNRIIVQEKEGYEGKMYYNSLHQLFMKYQNPKYMGLDNIFVYIMGEYYVNNKRVPERVANDSAYMKKILDRYADMSNNKIGDKSKDLQLYTNKDQWMRLHSIDADYIILYFYDIDCGHCKKVIPEWHRLFLENDLAAKKVMNLYVYTQTEMNEWKEFVTEKNLDLGSIHAFDPYQNTNFRENYDIYSTPVSYILDKDKKIIAKRLPPETLIDVLAHELKFEVKDSKKKEVEDKDEKKKNDKK